MTKNQTYSHIAKDLIWAIKSPPLIILPSEFLGGHQATPCEWYKSDFYRDLYNASKAWFSDVSCNPEKIKALVGSQKDKRLGKLFETLWATYLNESERFEIVEQNLQIIDGGKTLGELDLIVVDRKANKMLHWELAVKFYLGIGDTSKWSSWYGPAKKDRLDLKMSHLLNHQTKLGQHPATKKVLRSKNIKIDGSAVILKGCLFYPPKEKKVSAKNKPPEYSSADHCRSRWIRLHELDNGFDQAARFYPLIGQGWMASMDVEQYGQLMTSAELKLSIDKNDYRLPLLVSVVENNIECEKVFVVQETWHND